MAYGEQKLGTPSEAIHASMNHSQPFSTAVSFCAHSAASRSASVG